LLDFKISVDAKRAIERLDVDIAKIVKDELHKGGDNIIKDAKDNVHVVSGELKASDWIQKREREVEGGFRKDYARVEENRTGGKYAGSHGYLKPAFDRNVPIIAKDMERAIKEALQ
jgi:hypothetical protein